MKYNARRRSVISAILAALVLLGAVSMPCMQTEVNAVTQAEINAKKNEKAALQTKIKDQQTKMNALANEKAAMTEQKQALDEQQELMVQQLNVVKEELEMYRQMIVEKEEEARIAQENADYQLEQYKLHLRNMEEENLSNMYMDLLFSSEDFSDLITRIDTISEIMEYDTRVRNNYLQAKADALTAKEEYEAAAAELEVKEVELNEEITSIEGELTTLQTQLEALQSDINGYASVIAEYEAAENAIDAQIKKMTEELKAQQTPPTATGSYTWPTPSCKIITSRYGNRTIELYGYERFHAGVDIGASMGAAIVAADGGTVTVSTYGGGYGNYVMINHGEGRVTLYGHMSARAVSAGATVTKGQVIGYVGSTGNSTGPHLHFEVRVNGSCVNPLQYFSGYTFYNC